MKTEMELSEVKNETIAKSLLTAIEMRERAYWLEDKAKRLKEDANILIEPLLSALDTDKVKSNLGTVSLYTSTRSKFDLKGFKEELIRKSVPVDIIATAEGNNTTTTTSDPTVKFTVKKEGK